MKPTHEVAPFQNEPVKDFRDPADAAAMKSALAAVRGQLGKTYPLVIGGRKIETEKTIRSVNPANPDEVVGITSSASKDQAEQAIAQAATAFESWRRRTLPERAAFLFKAAELLRARRLEYDALLVYEVGKSWVEADGDIAEAIDFLEYYAREALRYARPQPVVPLAGEENELVYIPLGVGAVIPPWNFAGAIMIGMTGAAIVCGNTVVLKPSSDAAVIAAWFVDLLHEIGVPPGVVNFIPGAGSEIGDLIVGHPQIRFISFTGSKEVGLRINELAAKPKPGQKWIKRVVAEMGGKDSIVVAADADVDAAVEGVAVSAFGFQGQKCSACSRAIVDEKVYDEFVAKLKRRVSTITVGDPVDQGNFMGPVVNEAALTSIMRYIERGQTEGRLLAGGRRAGDRGYFIEPTVIADVAPDATIAQEEIFGPVLAVIKARGFEDALAIANNTEFGLT
ncbi:MAG TPA: L-glutamate gamma-semialdehyde dehydrogenase, partial [Candidatus Dormibacteraeota bacterium]|nr:L-glutamate gamma-semialdehyde dehydrogenase [Candidatus Dormibacteraeota bacterium]